MNSEHQVVMNRLEILERNLTRLLMFMLKKEGRDMGTIKTEISDLQAAVAQESSVDASVLALVQGLAQKAQAAVDAGDLAAVQAVIDQMNANAKSLSDAVSANTAPAPGPVPDSSGGTTTVGP